MYFDMANSQDVKSALDLKNLSMPPVATEGDVNAAFEADKANLAAYRRKYGDREGVRRFMSDMGCSVERDYDIDAKRINTMLYRWTSPCVSGSPEFVSRFLGRYMVRQRELYGDRYGELVRGGGSTPELAGPLLRDAVRTGKWKELPDELQDEYRRLAGGCHG